MQTKGFFSFAQSVESARSHNHHPHQTFWVKEPEFEQNMNFKEIKVKLDFLCQIGHQFVITDHTGFGGLVENWDDRQTILIAVVCEETVTPLSRGARQIIT